MKGQGLKILMFSCITLLWILVFQNREEDSNGDGRNDVLQLQLDVPLLDTESVLGVNLILVFDYKLYVGASVWILYYGSSICYVTL